MKKKQKLLILSIITSILLFAFLFKNRIFQNEIEVFNDKIEFYPSFEKPYTHDLKYYNHAISVWKNNFDKKYISQFPEKLSNKIEYDFFYIPALMQGKSKIELKMLFDKEEEALNYFINNSKGYKFDFSDLDEYRNTLFCFPNFNFKSEEQLKKEFRTRLLHLAKCSGKSADELGGIVTGISLNQKTIILWTNE